MNCMYLASGIVLAVFALVMLVFAIIMIINGDLNSFRLFLFTALLLGGFSTAFFCPCKMTPEKKYQSLVKDLEKAQKELEKFYIDHPELKVEEVE